MVPCVIDIGCVKSTDKILIIIIKRFNLNVYIHFAILFYLQIVQYYFVTESLCMLRVFGTDIIAIKSS